MHCLLAERRHRYNYRTVPIHSDELGAALAAITLSPAVTAKFTSDQRYLCARMGTQAPLLPVHGEEEGKLFDLLVRTTCADLDMDRMALEWCKHVDGVNISPKLPVYLRTYHSAWTRNQRVREAVRTAVAGEAVLTRINAETLQALLPASAPALAPAAPEVRTAAAHARRRALEPRQQRLHLLGGRQKGGGPVAARGGVVVVSVRGAQDDAEFELEHGRRRGRGEPSVGRRRRRHPRAQHHVHAAVCGRPLVRALQPRFDAEPARRHRSSHGRLSPPTSSARRTKACGWAPQSTRG